MSKRNQVKTEPAAVEEAQAPVAASKISADEFGIRQSVNDKRVELLGAFVAREKRAGRHSDTEAAYRERLEQFAKQPA